MTDGDITWEEMWAEEELQRQTAAEAARLSGSWSAPEFPSSSWEAEPAQPMLAPEPYFGEQAPHHPEPQPYFEFSADPVGAQEDSQQPPALRVTLPSSAPARPTWRDPGEERVEGLDELDWQAPPPVAAEESGPSARERAWETTWADDIHRHRPKHAK
ncbi:hypothetical protein [Segniliparus rugosus]|uniref:Uncharacterized protein n=1 Tax=Segniliparus rugosus (strain ATCC BAA-974 / DSM 45345 / CCUG 50838 / CIP 108380 / JCM 13579 / CDC 945) TaxID=679197 RepID=E5XLM3_SEGRC|nr:hypothetical protein [Segniliparus rugosus]EFV14701.1 hypothetical protein HMPREF9336_00392 [Segniliparus rugosus ATCC BAA-974]